MSELTTQSRLEFGKYRGRLVSDILQIDPQYLKWLMKKQVVTFNSYLNKMLK